MDATTAVIALCKSCVSIVHADANKWGEPELAAVGSEGSLDGDGTCDGSIGMGEVVKKPSSLLATSPPHGHENTSDHTGGEAHS